MMKYLRSFCERLHFRLMLLFLLTVIISLLCYQLFNDTLLLQTKVVTSENIILSLFMTSLLTVLLYLLRTLPVTIFMGIPLYYFSHRFILRIRQLTMTAKSWSQGDFSVAVKDNRKDEIGQLTWHLNSMAQQLQNTMEMQQELASSNERNRLARELHDTVKQQIFALRFQIAIARKIHQSENDQLGMHLQEAENILQDIQKEMTNLIFPMRQAFLENQDLADALASYFSKWSHQYGIFITFTANIEGQEKNFFLPPHVKMAFFRVAQEALSNVARHSKASSVRITLTIGWLYITLRIVDNGQGFDFTKQKDHGVGLSSMQERIKAINGKLKITSVPSSGTEVIATYKAKEPGPNVAEIPTYRSDTHPHHRLPRATQPL